MPSCRGVPQSILGGATGSEIFLPLKIGLFQWSCILRLGFSRVGQMVQSNMIAIKLMPSWLGVSQLNLRVQPKYFILSFGLANELIIIMGSLMAG